jgi:DNA-binding beta-propeller fold protein YncE
MTNKKTLLGVLCLLAAFQPHCTRNCPTGFLDFGCNCKWDWDECPPPPSCNSSSALVASDDAGMLVVAAPDGALVERTQDASTFAARLDETPGGTLAFAQTTTGTFAVAVITELDLVRVIRVDLSDDGAMRAHVLGDVALGHGQRPERVVVDDRGLAHVVLRGSGEIATIDPVKLGLVSRWRPCAAPRDLAFDHAGSALVVACEPGDVVTLDAATGEETKRTFVDRGLHHLAMDGSAIVASTRARLFVMGADGTFAMHDDGRPLIAFDTRGPDVVIAHDDGIELAPLDGSPGRSLDGVTSAVSDVRVGDDGTIVVVANGGAFVLPTGAPAFSRLPATGFVKAVGLAREGARSIVGLQTAEATVVFSALAGTGDLVVVE